MFIDGITSGLAAFHLVDKRRDELIAQFSKQPQVKRDLDYYTSHIGNVKSVDDLLKDRRLLTVALSAFQLEDEVDAKGLLKKVLTQDPTDRKSLVNQLADSRFRQFATAFASLNTDGGATIRAQSSIDTVLDGYRTNQFEKAMGETNPAVRQALYFERQVAATIDVKNLNGLLGTFAKSTDFAQTAQYYRDNIANVTKPADLIADPKLLKVALSAFHLESLADAPATVTRLLTENASNTGALAKTDPRFQNFASAFLTLRFDGGAQIQGKAAVDATVSAFQSSEFNKALVADAGKQRTLLSAAGANTVADLAASFAKNTTFRQNVDHFRSTIGTITSVDALMNDGQALKVALSAFHLDALAGSPDTVRTLLTQDPSAAGSLAQFDPGYATFAKAFAPLRTKTPLRNSAAIESMLGNFQKNEFVKSLAGKVQQAATSTGTFKLTQFIADPTLGAVAREALHLPTAVAALSVAQQTAAMSRAGLDPAKLQDPKALSTFLDRFLTADDAANSGGNPMLALFSSGQNDGTTAGGGLLNLLV